MKNSIKPPKKMKISKAAKYKKVEVPAVKTAKKALAKAEKNLKIAKQKLSTAKKASK